VQGMRKICIYVGNIVNMLNILDIFGGVVIFIKQNYNVPFPFEVRLVESLKFELVTKHMFQRLGGQKAIC
jgi:hypothetical protein